MSISEIVLIVSGVLSAIGGTGYFTWLFARSKYIQDVEKMKVEVLQAQKTAETTEIENGSKVVTMYKDALDDLNTRYSKKFEELESSSTNKLQALEALYKQKEAHLMKEVEYHAKQSALYEKMYNDKVKEFNKYKRDHK